MPAARTRRKRSLQAAGLGRQSAGASTTKPSRIRRKAGMARCVAQVGIRMGATQTVGADDLPPVPVAPRLDAGRRLHPDRPCHGRSAHATVSRHFPPTRRRGGQDGAVAFARDWIPRNWTSFIPSSSARSCSPSSCRRSRHALASTPRTRVHATHSRPRHALASSFAWSRIPWFSRTSSGRPHGCAARGHRRHLRCAAPHRRCTLLAGDTAAAARERPVTPPWRPSKRPKQPTSSC